MTPAALVNVVPQIRVNGFLSCSQKWVEPENKKKCDKEEIFIYSSILMLFCDGLAVEQGLEFRSTNLVMGSSPARCWAFFLSPLFFPTFFRQVPQGRSSLLGMM